ncbi:hypothetical protein ACHQM5_011847 [Ranunculus cassubicifolius]
MMDGFSTADGFVEVNESVADMIKYVANEPSVGLYFVQQHTHNALPNLLKLQDKVVSRTRETTLHTQDLEESIVMVDSMKHCGLSLAHDMINDINKSLLLISKSQPQRGLLRSSSSVVRPAKSGSREPPARTQSSVFGQHEAKHSSSYFSAVLKSAKEKASSIKWPQLDPEQSTVNKSDQQPLDQSRDEGVGTVVSTPESEELPFSSHVLNNQIDESLPTHELSSEAANYEEFKANKEAKLKKWLEEHEEENQVE